MRKIKESGKSDPINLEKMYLLPKGKEMMVVCAPAQKLCLELEVVR